MRVIEFKLQAFVVCWSYAVGGFFVGIATSLGDDGRPVPAVLVALLAVAHFLYATQQARQTWRALHEPTSSSPPSPPPSPSARPDPQAQPGGGA